MTHKTRDFNFLFYRYLKYSNKKIKTIIFIKIYDLIVYLYDNFNNLIFYFLIYMIFNN